MSGGTWLLLRGLTREAGHWGGFVPLLGERVAPAAVIPLDLPGAGQHWQASSPTTIAAITDDLRRRAATLERPWRLLGLSLGGMVALDWASRHPQDVAGALLVNTSMRPFGRLRQRLRPLAWLPLMSGLVGPGSARFEADILRLTSARPDAHESVLAHWIELRRRRPVSRLNALRQLLAAARFAAPAARPQVPIRLLCAGADALVDPDCSRALSRAWSLPLAEHPAAGHDLPLDAPQWVADQAAAFERLLRA